MIEEQANEGLRIAGALRDPNPDDPIESGMEAALGEIEERFRRIIAIARAAEERGRIETREDGTAEVVVDGPL